MFSLHVVDSQERYGENLTEVYVCGREVEEIELSEIKS